MTEKQGPSRILVVDDHAIVRRGLVSLLSGHADMTVVGEAADGESAIAMAGKLSPDVVIMDVRMPGMDGIEACRRISQVSSNSKVVFLTSFPDEEALVGAMLAGAKGYVLKNLADDSLLDVVRAVAQGRSVLDPSLGASVAEGMKRLASGTLGTRKNTAPATMEERSTARIKRPVRGASPFDDLTDLELTLLRLISEGRTNREIAERLHFAEKTIRNYVSTLLSKLNLHNRAEAAAYAVRHHLSDSIESPSPVSENHFKGH